MFKKIKVFFENAWKWIQALWDKHDDHLEEMVKSILPMVIDVAFRNDLSGEEKKRAIVDAIIDNAEAEIGEISSSLLNEAVEIAAAKYNIQIGKLTVEKMDASLDAALKAGRDYANNTLKITGEEAETLAATSEVEEEVSEVPE
jgi:broad-specificity NMP kinase